MVSPEGFSRDWDIDWAQVIGTPYFGSVHWHRGLKHFREPYNVAAMLGSKKNLVLYSGVVRQFPGHTTYEDSIPNYHMCAGMP